MARCESTSPHRAEHPVLSTCRRDFVGNGHVNGVPVAACGSEREDDYSPAVQEPVAVVLPLPPRRPR